MEKELKAKLEKYDKFKLEKDIENKRREISEAERTIELTTQEVERIEQEIVIFGKVSAIMLENYGKLPEKYEHKWETQPEYWELMSTKQKLENDRAIIKYKSTILALEKQKRHAEESLDGLKKSSLLQEQEVK